MLAGALALSGELALVAVVYSVQVSTMSRSMSGTSCGWDRLVAGKTLPDCQDTLQVQVYKNTEATLSFWVRELFADWPAGSG